MQIRINALDFNEQIELRGHGHYVQFIGSTRPQTAVLNAKLRSGESVITSSFVGLPMDVQLSEEIVHLGNAFHWGN